MGFAKHTPTAGITERTLSTYYGAVKSWASTQADILQYFNVTADDSSYTLTLTPKDADVSYFITTITVNTSAVNIDTRYTALSLNNIVRLQHNNYYADVDFYIYNGGNDFVMTFGDRTKCVANIGGKSIDSGAAMRAIVSRGTYLAICTSGSTYAWYTNSTSTYINRNCSGKSDGYYLSRLMIPNTGIITDGAYTCDGGAAVQPNMFKLGGVGYYTLAANVVLKIS